MLFNYFITSLNAVFFLMWSCVVEVAFSSAARLLIDLFGDVAIDQATTAHVPHESSYVHYATCL